MMPAVARGNGGFRRRVAVSASVGGSWAVSWLAVAAIAWGCGTAVAADPEVTRLLADGERLLGTGDYAEAERVAREAAAAARRAVADDDVQRVYVDLLLGRVLKARADYAGALETFTSALTWLEKAAAYGPDHPAVAAPLVNIADISLRIGDLPAAERDARRAVAVNERHPDVGPDHEQTALALHALAGVLEARGDFAGAVEMLDRTVNIKARRYGNDSPQATVSTQYLGFTYFEKGDYAKAEPLLERVLANVEKQKGPDHPDTAVACNGLARLYRAMGRYDRSAMLQRRAAEILERSSLPAEHPLVARIGSNMGELLLSVGKPAEARQWFERSAAIREKTFGGSHALTGISWQNLAFAAAGLGDWAAALDAADRGRRSVRRHVSRVLPALSDREQLQYIKVRDEENLHGCLSIGLARPGDAAAAERSAGWLANAKAVGQEAAAERAQIARRSDDPAARKALDDLAAVRQELAGLRQAAAGGTSATRIADLERRECEIILRLGLAVPWRDAEDPWVTIEAIRAAIPRGTVFVDIARIRPRDFALTAAEGRRFEPYKDARYVAWIVPPAGRGRVTVVDLGEAARIDPLVAAYIKVMETAGGPGGAIQGRGEAAAERELTAAAAPLSKLTLQPILAAAKQADGDDPEELVVSPDGPLWLVPFAALVREDGRYAIESVAIRHVTSGRELAVDGDRQREDDAGAVRRPLIMAAPNYDSASAGTAAASPTSARSLAPPMPPSRRLRPAQPLPGTLVEARGVAGPVARIAATEPEIVLADEATETRFKQTARPTLAVLATHGFFLPDQRIDPLALAIRRAGDGRGVVDKEGEPLENPLTRCGLMFAGCNRPAEPGGEDGVLTGLEILGCDLRGTRLVMLSACQTGLGDVEAGEGVAGLRQAFLLAGAEDVVSTLWSVPDRETVDISTALFDALAAGRTPAQAVRQAQVALIQSRRDLLEAAHPYFWAAFTVTGR